MAVISTNSLTIKQAVNITFKSLSNGNSRYNQIGTFVNYIGDFNKDGYDDIGLVYNLYNTQKSVITQCYYNVIYGNNSYNSNINLGSLNINEGVNIYINSTNYPCGQIAGAGDVNGDGYKDILIGFGYNGYSYLVYGAEQLNSIDLSKLSLNQGIKIYGNYSASIYNGITPAIVNSAGDLDKDGYDDFIIGMPASGYLKTPATTYSYVIYGSNSLSNINLNNLTPGEATIIYQYLATSSAEYYDFFSASVSSVGDTNKDGYNDIAISTQGSYASGPVVYVLHGSNLFSRPYKIEVNTLTSSQGYIISLVTNGNPGSVTVTKAGDFNGDSIDDILIGYPSEKNTGTNYCCNGAVYIIYGSLYNANITVSDMSITEGLIIYSSSEASFGFSVSSIQDINEDGYDDIIVGTPYYTVGSAYIYLGGQYESNINFENAPISILYSNSFTTSEIGYSVGFAGNFSGQNSNDIMVGIPYSESVNIIYGDTINKFLPTLSPTHMPSSFRPTYIPSENPVAAPIHIPVGLPTNGPNNVPSLTPTTFKPSFKPSAALTDMPTHSPSFAPTTANPIATLSFEPSVVPSGKPNFAPSNMPSLLPTHSPISDITLEPGFMPSTFPSIHPSGIPSIMPTFMPTQAISISTGGSYESVPNTNYIISADSDVTINGESNNNMYTLIPNANVKITITNFNNYTNFINLESYNIYSYNQLNITSGSVIITLPDNQIMKLSNLYPSDVSASNFVLSSENSLPNDSSSNNQDAIIGGVIGGVAFMVLTALGVYYFGGKYLSGMFDSTASNALDIVTNPVIELGKVAVVNDNL